jgi:LAO/AO transport system kinase
VVTRQVGQQYDIDELYEGVLKAETLHLARAITLIESQRHDHRELADQLLTKLLPHTGKSLRIGLSGVPGAGKSTFTEAFGTYVTEQGHRIAVLAIDPSSPKTKGSILGDKTRMEHLATNPNAYIRPTPSGCTLGGVARRTREAMLVCEAAGYDIILIETVGVGQSEIAVAQMTDVFVLILVPGGGDELQGIKKGIVELADVLVVNKADGDLDRAADRAKGSYQNALQLLYPSNSKWIPPVLKVSSVENRGVDTVWETLNDFKDVMHGEGLFEKRRMAQARDWMWSEVGDNLMEALRAHPAVNAMIGSLEGEVAHSRATPSAAAKAMMEAFVKGSYRP